MTSAQYRQTESEHSLQASLDAFLSINHAPHVFWFAIPNAGKRTRWAAMRLKREGMISGVADLCIMLPGGGVLWLELKAGGRKQSEAQLAFEGICAILDHPYCVAHTLERAIAFLRHHGALR